MFRLDESMLTRINRALAWGAATLLVLVAMSKIGFSRNRSYLSPASWAEIWDRMPNMLIFSAIIFLLVLFYPRNQG